MRQPSSACSSAWAVGAGCIMAGCSPVRAASARRLWLIASPASCSPHPDHRDVRNDAPQNLDVAPDDPAAALVTARSHPDLLVVAAHHRPQDRAAAKAAWCSVEVSPARQASSFHSLRPWAAGGCALSTRPTISLRTAANALLKVLEEPPARSVFVILAHAPGRLLATIRSRSIRLDLKPLETGAVLEVHAASLASAAKVVSRRTGSHRRPRPRAVPAGHFNLVDSLGP
jgi:hypothetical protein